MPDKYINNASLLPEIISDEYVHTDENGTPDWAASLIMAQIRPATATPEGTLKAAVRVLDHYAEMGINCIWVSPVYDPEPKGNGYSNLGPHTVDPHITGTVDYSAGWLEVKRFVNQAHKRNIRIILDLISWGTVKGSKLFEEHPEWYTGEDEWGGDAFNWSNEEFKEWYISVAVGIVMQTGCDGLRYDVEPHYAGYDVNREIRKRLLELGRKPFMLSEWDNERMGAYDCEQIGITGSTHGYYEEKPEYYFLDMYNLVDSIKTGHMIGGKKMQENGTGGMFKYYVNTLTCHDHKYPVILGNRLAIGYQDIFAPFIPLWYIGEEWINPREEELDKKGAVLYFNKIDWELIDKPENRAFFEDVKQMLRIRREHPDIFCRFADSTRAANICKVEAKGGNLQAYARYANDKAIIILPNYDPNNTDGIITAKINFTDIGLNENEVYGIYNAATHERLSDITDGAELKYKVNYLDQGVLLIKKDSEKA